MKTTIYSLSAAMLISCASLFSSCEGYLDTLPTDSLVSDEAITTPEDTKVAANGLYEGLIIADNNYFYGIDFIARAEVGGDDTQTRQVGDRTQNFYRYTDRQTNAISSLWAAPYVVINRANVLLKAIDGGQIEMTDVTKNSKGEALAVRALAHFDLLITYGTPYLKDNGASLGVPIVKSVKDATELPARNTVAEGYQAVLDDLTESLKFISSEKNYGHFNAWAVKALMARVNLYKGNYDEAYKYAKEVIEKSGYKLVPNEKYVEMWGQQENDESIFDLNFSPTMYGGARELIGAVASPKEYGAMIATKAFVDLLKEDPNDVRNQLLIPAKTKGQFLLNKYPGRDGNVIVNNVRVIRLSEVYLIGAEAALKKAQKDQITADNYLYEIRHRANPEATQETATLELIVKERRKELAMEGHRLYDILRTGESVTRAGGFHFLNSVDLVTVNWDDYRTILPIPQAEIDVNPNLKQNPGY